MKEILFVRNTLQHLEQKQLTAGIVEQRGGKNSATALILNILLRSALEGETTLGGGGTLPTIIPSTCDVQEGTADIRKPFLKKIGEMKK
jgi:hypothetical protein